MKPFDAWVDTAVSSLPRTFLVLPFPQRGPESLHHCGQRSRADAEGMIIGDTTAAQPASVVASTTDCGTQPPLAAIPAPVHRSPVTSGSVSITDPGLTNRSQFVSTARAHRHTLHGRVIADGFPRLHLRLCQETSKRTVRFNDAIQDGLLVRKPLSGIQLITDCLSLSQKRCDALVIEAGAICLAQTLRKLHRESHEPWG